MLEFVKFIRGFLIPFHGFYVVLTSFKLFVLSVIPFWLAVGLGISLFVSFWSQADQILFFLIQYIPFVGQLVEMLQSPNLSFLGLLFSGFVFVFLFLFMLYFSYILLSILGSPFYSLMADHILLKKGVRPELQNSFLRWLYTTLKMLMLNIMKLIVFMVITFFLFVVSFWSLGIMLVPFMIGLMIAYDCVDFSMECMNFTLARRFRFFKEHFLLFLGLAVSVILFSMIPFLFTICLPFFIAGAAQAFADIHQQGAVA